VSWSPDHAEFDRSQLVTFLRAVDGNLPEPLTAIVIGGSAAILARINHDNWNTDVLHRTVCIRLVGGGGLAGL
jgi:hypothetical protein